MKEAKIDFDSLKVGKSLSNRGLAQKNIPLALIGTEIIEGGPPTDRGAARGPTVKG